MKRAGDGLRPTGGGIDLALGELARTQGLKQSTLEAQVGKLRKALPNGKALIQTNGEGYRFDLAPHYLNGPTRTLGSMTVHTQIRAFEKFASGEELKATQDRLMQALGFAIELDRSKRGSCRATCLSQ